MKSPALVSLLLCGGVLLPMAVRAQAPFSLPPAAPSVFTKIGIRHYDAGVMADLATRPSGIIVVPPNFVIPAGGGPSSLLASPVVTTIGGLAAPSPFAAVGAAPSAPVAAPATANVLPAGVRRIFVLEGDNSLVIEGTPEAAQSLRELIEGTAGN